MLPQTSCALRRRLLCSATALALISSPVSAQEEGVFQILGRLILGAGSAKVAIDTPQAVTSLEQEDLDRAQPSNLGDVFKAIPGVQAAGASARALGQAFNIRGIGNSEQTASEARIIVTVDGAPKFFEQYRMGSFFGDLDLFKRVEVLRGPASSTLYGSGAIGGAVAFTTKDAADFIPEGRTTTLQFKSGFDSNGNARKLGLIFATRQGAAEYLGALNLSDSKALTDGAGNLLAGTAHQRVSSLLKGKWALADDQSLTLSLSRTATDLDDTLVAQTGGAAVAGFGTSDVRAVDDTVTLAWTHGFADTPLLDLTVQLSYTDTSVAKDDFSFGSLCAPGRNQVLCDSDYGYATTSLKVENRAEFSVGSWENHLTAGLQLSEQTRSATSSAGPLAFHPEGTDRKAGAYLQAEMTWNDRLTLIPGVRVDFGDIRPGAGAAAAGATAQSDRAVSPKLAVMYKLSDQVSVFGSVSRTERLPTLDELYSTEAESFSPITGLYSAARSASLNLEKETADTIELGATYQTEGLLSVNDSLQLKATAFHNDLTNMIAASARPVSPAPGLTPVAYFSNIAAARLWGAELEVSYDSDFWFSSLAYSHVKSKDKTTGLTLADTPAENLALTVGAKLPDHNMTIGWRGYYFDKITTASATTSGSAYDTHDLFVTWSPDTGVLAGLDVNLTVENLFNAQYRNNLSLDPSPGRTAKLSVTKAVTW